MSDSESRELFVECGSCGVENLYNNYIPGKILVCNQCRERIAERDVEENYNAYECDDCEMFLLLLKKTVVTEGESTCRCGSSNISEIDTFIVTEKIPDLLDEDEIEPLEDDEDWLRPGNSVLLDDDGFNDLFDQDPSMS